MLFSIKALWFGLSIIIHGFVSNVFKRIFLNRGGAWGCLEYENKNILCGNIHLNLFNVAWKKNTRKIRHYFKIYNYYNLVHLCSILIFNIAEIADSVIKMLRVQNDEIRLCV